MTGLVILAVLGDTIVKEFTIPIPHIEDCLWAADVSYCKAVDFLAEQSKAKTNGVLDQERNADDQVTRWVSR
jgi:hypothetical protein